MRKLIVVALIAVGIWYWQKHGASHEALLDADGNPVVLIYTAKQCGDPCQQAINVLDAREVPYERRDLDLDDEQSEEVKHWSRISGNVLPLTLAGDSVVKSSSKWELIDLLGKNFGDQYLTPEEKMYFSQHFDADGTPKIVLYGTSWCPGCAALRKEFEDHGVSYVDIDVEKSGDFDRVTRIMEIPGYPATWVGYTRVQGVTYSDVKAAMN